MAPCAQVPPGFRAPDRALGSSPWFGNSGLASQYALAVVAVVVLAARGGWLVSGQVLAPLAGASRRSGASSPTPPMSCAPR